MEKYNGQDGNEFRAWKETIDNTPGFPMEGYDEDESWERLKAKMATRDAAQVITMKKRSYMSRYAAVASILLLLSLFLVTERPSEPVLIGKPKTGKPVNKIQSPGLVAKDPVIKSGDSANPNPVKNLAVMPKDDLKNTPPTVIHDIPVVNPEPKPDPLPLPLLIARAVRPYYIEHPNRTPLLRKPASSLVKHAGGKVTDMDEKFRELTGFALYKNP